MLPDLWNGLMTHPRYKNGYLFLFFVFSVWFVVRKIQADTSVLSLWQTLQKMCCFPEGMIPHTSYNLIWNCMHWLNFLAIKSWIFCILQSAKILLILLIIIRGSLFVFSFPLWKKQPFIRLNGNCGTSRHTLLQYKHPIQNKTENPIQSYDLAKILTDFNKSYKIEFTNEASQWCKSLRYVYFW